MALAYIALGEYLLLILHHHVKSIKSNDLDELFHFHVKQHVQFIAYYRLLNLLTF